MMKRERRIPSLEITGDAEERIEALCRKLRISDYGELVDRAIKAFEVLADVADNDHVVEVNSPGGKNARRIRIAH